MIRRREFVQKSLMGAGALLFSRRTPFPFATDEGVESRIEIPAQ